MYFVRTFNTCMYVRRSRTYFYCFQQQNISQREETERVKESEPFYRFAFPFNFIFFLFEYYLRMTAITLLAAAASVSSARRISPYDAIARENERKYRSFCLWAAP